MRSLDRTDNQHAPSNLPLVQNMVRLMRASHALDCQRIHHASRDTTSHTPQE